MPLSRRYMPEHSPGDTVTIGMDFSFVLPPGVGIMSGSLAIYTNTNPAVVAPVRDWGQVFPVSIEGRAVYCVVSGGVEGQDYQFRWTINDSEGNSWTRIGLMLCAPTS